MKYYSHRYIARITVEADTPISIGTGEKGSIVDRIIARDANFLPYLPGTSLAGVLRSSFQGDAFIEDIMGEGGEDGLGSRLIVSSGYLLDKDGVTVLDGLIGVDWSNSYYDSFVRLPERDHVRIEDKGTAAKSGKFDEEVVYKGSRFVFELELIGDKNDEPSWNRILNVIASPIFRIGAGTRKGFGKLKVIDYQSFDKSFDLRNEENLLNYLNIDSGLNHSIDSWNPLKLKSAEEEIAAWTHYKLDLKPKDFFIFSAGFGDGDADKVSKLEKYFDWSSGKPVLSEKPLVLIPATSVKGAIAHRVAFHYNQLNNVFIDDIDLGGAMPAINENELEREIKQRFSFDNVKEMSKDRFDELEAQINSLKIDDLEYWSNFKQEPEKQIEKRDEFLPVLESNQAVRTLFGFAKDSSNDKSGKKGVVIIDDFYLAIDQKNEKVFSHNKIDRFTGGTIDGALFQEKVIYSDGLLSFNIWVHESAFKDQCIKESFELALDDIRTGKLSLGGSTNKGYGVFVEI